MSSHNLTEFSVSFSTRASSFFFFFFFFFVNKFLAFPVCCPNAGKRKDLPDQKHVTIARRARTLLNTGELSKRGAWMLTSTRKQNPELVTSGVPITNTVQPQDYGSLCRVSSGHGVHHQHQKHMVFLVPWLSK